MQQLVKDEFFAIRKGELVDLPQRRLDIQGETSLRKSFLLGIHRIEDDAGQHVHEQDGEHRCYAGEVGFSEFLDPSDKEVPTFFFRSATARFSAIQARSSRRPSRSLSRPVNASPGSPPFVT